MGTYLLLWICVLKTWKGPPPKGMVLLHCGFFAIISYHTNNLLLLVICSKVLTGLLEAVDGFQFTMRALLLPC